MNKPKVTVLTSLYKCQKYLSSFLDSLSKLNHTDEIEVLLLHNEPQGEEQAIIKEKTDSLNFVKHIIIPERESLYKTWNRGIALALGEYICIWNVDDIRFPDSVYEQALTLDKNPDADLTYGDFYYMYKYGTLSNDLVENPPFSDKDKTFISHHHIGCFPMWRKVLHKTLGYFDEQFLLVADFDFQVRLSLQAKLVKTETVLGAYLENDPDKLSMNYNLQIKERTLLYLRYAVFDRVNWFFIPQTIISYNVLAIKHKEHFTRLVLPSFFRIKRLPLLLVSTVRQPRFFLAFIKHSILNK